MAWQINLGSFQSSESSEMSEYPFVFTRDGHRVDFQHKSRVFLRMIEAGICS